MIKKLTQRELMETNGGQGPLVNGVKGGGRALAGSLAYEAVKHGYKKGNEAAVDRRSSTAWDAAREKGPSRHSDAIRGPTGRQND